VAKTFIDGIVLADCTAALEGTSPEEPGMQAPNIRQIGKNVRRMEPPEFNSDTSIPTAKEAGQAGSSARRQWDEGNLSCLTDCLRPDPINARIQGSVVPHLVLYKEHLGQKWGEFDHLRSVVG
jgi:hypothetical protein